MHSTPVENGWRLWPSVQHDQLEPTYCLQNSAPYWCKYFWGQDIAKPAIDSVEIVAGPLWNFPAEKIASTWCMSKKIWKILLDARPQLPAGTKLYILMTVTQSVSLIVIEDWGINLRNCGTRKKKSYFAVSCTVRKVAREGSIHIV